MKDNVIRSKSFEFAVKAVKLARGLQEKKHEYILSKQLLKSGTSIGANVREGINAESKIDFIHKLGIAQKECDETLYWLDLLDASGFTSIEENISMKNDAEELLKIIRSIILTSKKNLNLHS